MSQFHCIHQHVASKCRGRFHEDDQAPAIGVALVAAVTILCAAPAARAQVFIETQVAEPMMVPGLGMRGQGKTGTGKISGRVLSTETGAPLRRAQVRLTAPEVGVKTALTDADGRFEFKDLPAGRFTVNASKSGHVSVQFGQSRPFESGPPDRARRQAGARQGGHLHAARRRHFRSNRRRVRRAGHRRHGQHDAADMVERPQAISGDGADCADQRSRSVPSLRSAARRVLRQRDFAERRDDGDGHGARRCGPGSRLATDLRLRADLLPRHDDASQCADASPSRSDRKRRTRTSLWRRCASRGSAAA